MEMGDHLLQIVLALGLVVGLVVVLGYAMKRINSGHFKSGGEIRVVASTFLGAKERILLLEVNGRQILVGVSAQNIRTLSEFPPGPAKESFSRVLDEARAT